MERTIIKKVTISQHGESLEITYGDESNADYDQTIVITVGKLNALASLMEL